MDKVDIKINPQASTQITNLLWNKLENISSIIVKQAKNAAPTGKTGKLKDSIKIQSESKTDMKILIGSVLPYAIIVEMGTSHRDPEPYLRSSLYKVLSGLGG